METLRKFGKWVLCSLFVLMSVGVIALAFVLPGEFVYAQDNMTKDGINGVSYVDIEGVINTDWVRPAQISIPDGTVLSVISGGAILHSDNTVDSMTHQYAGRILQLVQSAANPTHVLVIHEFGSADLVVSKGKMQIVSQTDGTVVLDTWEGCAAVILPPDQNGAFAPVLDGYVAVEGLPFKHNNDCTSALRMSNVQVEYNKVEELYQALRIGLEPTSEPTAEATTAP